MKHIFMAMIIVVLSNALAAPRGLAASDQPASSPTTLARPGTGGPKCPGLYVQNGVLMKDGRPYRGVGINYFSAFNRVLHDPADTSYRQGLASLRSAGVPFIRFSLNGFWPAEWKLYMKDRGQFFSRLDAFVRETEGLGIGLVPSFFWQFGAVPDLVGEPMDQWGNPDSKTHAFMREYVRAVVTRYLDSPAIWAWEFGNEFRLQVDLPGQDKGVPAAVPQLGTPATRSARDKMQRSAVECAQREFARLVRQIDPYRVLVTGDSSPRCSAYHLHTKGAWDRDTPAQWAAMLLRDNPDPYDSISIHIYPEADREFFEPRASLPDLLRVCQDVAAAAGKPLFVGEFGASRELGADRAKQYVVGMLDAIVDLRIPLAALWVYDLPMQDDSYNVTPANDRSWMLDAISQTNRRVQGGLSSMPVATRPASR